MKILRYTLLILMAAVASVAYSAKPAASAESILNALQAKVRAAAALDAVFTINGGNGPVQGNLQMVGAKFAMATPQLSVWYDGHTQWTMLKSSQEVSITEPTADELLVTNPFAILSSRQGHYTARRLADSNGRNVILLTPRDKSTGIDSFTLYIDKTTGWPSTIIIALEDGNKIEVFIDNISASKAKAPSTFVYDPKKYPAMEIIDLR